MIYPGAVKAQHQADLAPATVTAASRGEIRLPRRRRPVMPRPILNTFQAEAAALRLAMKLADGDPNRLWLEKDGSVLVLNHPRSERCISKACPACSTTGARQPNQTQPDRTEPD